MNPRHRIALIAAAKSAAVPVASCVAARVPPDHLLEGRTWEELAALVIVLAAAAMASFRLRAITQEPEDGRQHVSGEALREAHRLHSQMRLAGERIPPRLAVQERAYQRWRKDVQRQEQQREEATAA